MLRDTETVLKKLAWMRKEGIWPNGKRYLWTDAFGVVLLVSLYRELNDEAYLQSACDLVRDVDRVLGRSPGYRIGEAPDRDGQYYHYLAMWLYALSCLGHYDDKYRRKGIAIAKAIHPRFVLPGRGVVWKMKEDLSGPYPGYGLGGLDAYHGYVVYHALSAEELSLEIRDMRRLITDTYQTQRIDQDLGLGMMLWMSHFHPNEEWARVQGRASLQMLGRMWIQPPGYFCRHPGMSNLRFAFTNYGVSLGLQAVGAWPERVDALNRYFETYRSGDEYDREAITHVMGCVSHFPGAFLRQ